MTISNGIEKDTTLWYLVKRGVVNYELKLDFLSLTRGIKK
jgi:hypothetical protein